MKQYLLIPMGGVGQRFVDAGYKTYKSFLPLGNNDTVLNRIIKNFSSPKIELIIIGNSKKINIFKLKFPKKKTHFINIKSHKLGPLFSIYLASKQIKKIVGVKDNIFISYSDINWNWNYRDIVKKIKDKKIIVFTHTNFHPHLETNAKSDFCLQNKNKNIIKISEKKTLTSNYKSELLAVGCYFFNNYSLIEDFFIKNPLLFKKKRKEFYIVSLINHYLKKKIKINHVEIKNFVHLGSPEQYEDFINWRSIIINKFHQCLNFNNSNIMLMGGRGKRVQKLSQKKPFLLLKGLPAYKFIIKKLGSKNNLILTIKDYVKTLKKEKFKIHLIKKTNSMFSTVERSKKVFFGYNNFFLTSCDCYGEFKKNNFNKFLKRQNPDLVIFGYDFSLLQRKLKNSHTSLTIKNKKLLKINVKSNSNDSKIGHAGFFWIKNNRVFNFLEKFKKQKKINREILIDDYFKFLFDKNKVKVSFYKLDNYIHIGSILEYEEFKYWENYFLNEH